MLQVIVSDQTKTINPQVWYQCTKSNSAILMPTLNFLCWNNYFHMLSFLLIALKNLASAQTDWRVWQQHWSNGGVTKLAVLTPSDYKSSTTQHGTFLKALLSGLDNKALSPLQSVFLIKQYVGFLQQAIFNLLNR